MSGAGVEQVQIESFYLPPSLLRRGVNDAVEGVWHNLTTSTPAPSNPLGMPAKLQHIPADADMNDDVYHVYNSEPQNRFMLGQTDRNSEVTQSMKSCIKNAGVSVEHPNETEGRGKYILSQFQPLSESRQSLVDGCRAQGSISHSSSSSASLHYRGAWRGSYSTGPEMQRGYAAFVQTKISAVITESLKPAGNFGKPEREARARTSPVLASGMNPLRLPALFEKLGHSNVIMTGDTSSQHKDVPRTAGIANRQSEQAWKNWKTGMYGKVSLSDGVMEFAKTHSEIQDAFRAFPHDADRLYPGWRVKLGCAGATMQKGLAASSAAAKPSAISYTAPARPPIYEDFLFKRPSCKLSLTCVH